MKNNLPLRDGFVILSAIAFLLFCSAPVLGCYYCYPPCGACQKCQGGVCVNQCQSSQCQACVNGQCQSLCNICQTCVNGQCQAKCNPVTQICVDGQCIDKLTITYTYDEVGNRLTMTGPEGATSYTYDYLSRLLTVTNPDSKTISYEYNANGNRTQMTDPANNVTTYTYDDDGRLETVIAPAGSTTYQYDSLSRQTRVDYPNGTYTQYTYNSQRNWLVSLVNKDLSGTVLSSYSYTSYDSVGNRLSVTEQDSSAVSYSYDDTYQLTSETRTGTNPYTIAYQYDSVGNRTQMVKNSVTTAYTYNNNNQLTTETAGGTTVTYSYNLNGNLVSKTGGGNTTSYTWDWRNLLLSVSSAESVIYEYDGDGTRLSKTTAGVQTKYINDVAFSLVQVLMETNNAGVVQAIYNYGNDLISMNRSGVNSYYNYDGLGSVKQMTDSAGAVTVTYTYDAFGNLIASTGSINNAYGFTGEQQFAEADNLVFLRARYYNPYIGRFLSRDPIEYYDSMNMYQYCLNNSINFTDPEGLMIGIIIVDPPIVPRPLLPPPTPTPVPPSFPLPKPAPPLFPLPKPAPPMPPIPKPGLPRLPDPHYHFPDPSEPPSKPPC